MSNGNGGVSYIFIVIVIVLSVMLATASSYFMFFKLGGASSQVSDNENMEKKELGPTSSIGEFVVNMAESSQFVKVNIVFEVSNDKVIEEINRRMPQIRDIIISILRAKKFEEISSNDGTTKLRTEIMNKVNNNLMEGKITNVFFTEFVVQ